MSELRPLPVEEWSRLSDGLNEHAKAEGMPRLEIEMFGLGIDGPDGLIAGLGAKLLWNWMYVDLLWVEKDQRGRGLGRRLMEAAEAEARRRDCAGIYLWTQTWQAGGFYESLGFKRVFEFPDFPRGHARLAYVKRL